MNLTPEQTDTCTVVGTANGQLYPFLLFGFFDIWFLYVAPAVLELAYAGQALPLPPALQCVCIYFFNNSQLPLLRDGLQVNNEKTHWMLLPLQMLADGLAHTFTK